VNADTRLIAVIMPNDQSVKGRKWKDYLVRVSDVEALTGYSFFNKVPPKIITPLKREIDDGVFFSPRFDGGMLTLLRHVPELAWKRAS
jgi:DNA/RNA endonuclease G (NUC1)